MLIFKEQSQEESVQIQRQFSATEAEILWCVI